MQPLSPPTQSNTLAQVVVLGDIIMDVLMHVPAYPQPGGDGLAERMEMELGGSATNTAVALSRLGVDTRLIGQVGEDGWADLALAALNRETVRLDALSRLAGEATGLTFLAVTPDGERTMFTYRGANQHLPASAVQAEALAGARILHLSGYAFLTPPQSEAAWRALELAKQLGLETCLDMGVEPASALGGSLPRLLRQLSVLILGPKEALAASGQPDLEAALAWLLEQGIDWIGLKLGRQGCRLLTPRGEIHAPGFQVAAVDTTGAGDAFSAGLLLARLTGLELASAGLLANALGALASTRCGAGAALPGLSELTSFLEQQLAAQPGLSAAIGPALSLARAQAQSEQRGPA